jgi:pimeloyl-ACP methyl ester carboxylesterase
MSLLRRKCIVAWAAISLLCCSPTDRLSAGEPAKPDVSDDDEKSSPYRIEDLVVLSGDHNLAGSLYLPLSGTLHPAVIFVHGAGPTVRSDGYRELANHFAQNGIAALIYDKRGCGESTGNWGKASLHDLADDALACVRLLRDRPEINPSQVGLWGLSQGASIIPIAAADAPEVSFVIAVGGCLDFEEQMRYFRSNVYRRLGYSKAVLDIANKAELARMDFSNRIRSGALPALSAWREGCRFEFDLDHAAIWRQVRQPILAIYGQRDQQVPVAESSANLSAAVRQSGNRNFTLMIYPNASHAIGQTRTGELGEEWVGYVPAYLEDMTDWVLRYTAGKETNRPLRQDHATEVDRPFATGNYDRIRWFGNSIVQGLLFLVFGTVFVGQIVVGATILAWRRNLGNAMSVVPSGRWIPLVAMISGVLNLVLLIGLVVLVIGLADPWEPKYPPLLSWLPLAGSVSVCLTLVLAIWLFIFWRALAISWPTKTCLALSTICDAAFVPFLLYWNLIGVSLG